MASQNGGVTAELNALAGCSICLDDCNDPRALPCLHTFCLKCLRNLARRKSPGRRIRCPLCRKKSSIPEDGVGGLPKNPMVSRIIEISNISRKEYDDRECAERERLKKNAEKVSLMIMDVVRDAKLRRKATVNINKRNKQEKEKIRQKIETLKLKLADVDARIRNLDVLGEETEKMDQHLATLESYKDYCLGLVEKGTASEISLEVPCLDKRLQQLEEIHESRVQREFNVRQNLLEDMDIASSSWPNTIESVNGKLLCK